MTAANSYYFEVHKSLNNQYFFRFRAPNHEIIVVSETYVAKANALYAISLLKSFAAGALVHDMTHAAA